MRKALEGVSPGCSPAPLPRSNSSLWRFASSAVSPGKTVAYRSMAPGSILGNSAIAFLVMGAIGVVFGWAVWHAGRSRGGRAMLVGWIAAAAIVTAPMTFQIHLAPEQQASIPIFGMFLPFWAASTGGVTLVVWRAIRRGADRFTLSLAGRSFGAWLPGALAYLIVFATLDVTSLLPAWK